MDVLRGLLNVDVLKLALGSGELAGDVDHALVGVDLLHHGAVFRTAASRHGVLKHGGLGALGGLGHGARGPGDTGCGLFVLVGPLGGPGGVDEDLEPEVTHSSHGCPFR